MQVLATSHKCGGWFSRKYGTKGLVHYEIFGDVIDAIAREKELKKWVEQHYVPTMMLGEEGFGSEWGLAD